MGRRSPLSPSGRVPNQNSLSLIFKQGPQETTAGHILLAILHFDRYMVTALHISIITALCEPAIRL